MANGFGYGFPFHAHWVDVGGNEIRWTRQRDDFAFFDYRRVLAYRKPFLPLNNEFFDREFTGEIAEEYFRWALFYGFCPVALLPVQALSATTGTRLNFTTETATCFADMSRSSFGCAKQVGSP